MSKRMELKAEQVAEIEAARVKNKNKNVERRLLSVLLYGQGVKREEVMLRTGFSKNHISDLARFYRNEGLEALTGNHYGGNHRNMSFEEEAAFLEEFRADAEAGNIVEVKDIKRALAEKLGRETRSRGHIYTVLERHGWRKVMPRSQHPNKADEATIEASKKLISE